MDGNSSKDGGDTAADAFDALWKEWEAIDASGEDDKSDRGRALRVLIKEYIEDNELDIAIIRSKTNYDLLNEIEDSLKNDAQPQETKESDKPAQNKVIVTGLADDEDDAPAADPTPAPQRSRNDDTNEPAVRPSDRRSTHPQRRR